MGIRALQFCCFRLAMVMQFSGCSWWSFNKKSASSAFAESQWLHLIFEPIAYIQNCQFNRYDLWVSIGLAGWGSIFNRHGQPVSIER
jgi:hypothetical protein